MSADGLSQLILSDAVSFRVKFTGEAPPMRERYWRGPVLDFFDGREWKDSGSRGGEARHRIDYLGKPVEYEIILEPQRHKWLLALEMVGPHNLPHGTFITERHQLVARQEVRERMLYRATSYPQYRLQFELSRRERAAELQMTRLYNPRTQELAREWREQGLDDSAIAQAALRLFREQEFFYTLRPPPTGRDAVDDFLFGTRKGFCQHYASAFTVLMRAAGIPAHVVIGYQGGEMNEFGDYYVVRQSDAHAWSEIWLEGRGWVRIDPTAAVAPERVEKGLAGADSVAAELPDFLARRGGFVFNLQARWDWANDKWNRLVLAYGPELQGEFLRGFGLRDWSDMILALTVATSLIMGIIGLLMMRQFAPAANQDVALRQWQRALRKLLRHGLIQRPHEGPQDFVQRLAHEHAQAAQAMQPLLQSYLQLRYLDTADAALQKRFAQQVRQLRL